MTKHRIRRLRLSPAMVVAFVALVVAIGGTSYAAIRLPANSVGSKQLKKQSVTRSKLKRDAVDASKVARDSLTGADVAEATLAAVPSATTAAHATSSDHAGSAAALDKLVYRVRSATVPAAPGLDQTSTAGASATCDAGLHIAGGGVRVEDPDNTAVVDSYPDGGGSAWTAHVDNGDAAAAHDFTVYAICIASGATG